MIFSTSSRSLVLSFLTWSLSVWPYALLHIFIFVISSFFTLKLVIGTVSIPYNLDISWLNYHLVNLSLNMWWYFLIAYDACHIPPVIQSTLCHLVYFCIYAVLRRVTFFYLSKSKSNCSQNYLSKSKSIL